MTKKSMNKLLSVVLTLAICFTTVFGCLMTVGAADTNCCTKWSVGSASSELDAATIYLAFTAVDPVAAEGFSAIEFALDGHADLDLQSIKAVATADGFASTTLLDSSTVDVNDLAVEISSDEKAVIVESQNAKAYASVVLELTYGFAGGYATQGAEYSVSASDIVLAGAFYTHICTSDAVAGAIKASCDHVIGVVGEPLKIDTANNYTVYENSVCTLCGEEFGIQLVPGSDVVIDDGTTITWSAEGAYDSTLADDGETGAVDSPIIINSVEELYYLAAKAGVAETANKYYKLADGISKVVFQSEANASTVIGLEDADKVESNFAAGSWFTWSGDSSKPFAGHFDGNGATFYGLYAEEAMVFGLFPYVAVADDALNADISDRLEANNSDYANNAFNINGSENYTANTVKVSNLNLKNSYVTINKDSTWSATAGFIFGKSVAIDGYLARYYATIEKCSIINCYMYSGSSSYGVSLLNGLFAGDFSACLKPTYIKTDGTSASWYGATNGVKINNCLAYGNSLKANNSYDDTFSIAGRANLSTSGMVSNSIFLGVLPYQPPCTTDNANAQNTFSSHRGNNAIFKNIYTDVEVLEVKYKDTPKYDANSNFTSVFTQITDLNSVKGSTAAATCSALDWGNTWLYDENGGYPYLASKVSNTTIYWDGKTATGIAEGSGTAEDPYIINTASELAYIAIAGYDATNDKIFKIADGIENIVLQSYAYGADIMALDSAADVKTYFEGLASPKNWVYKSYKDYMFAGTFDGNGATVYGLYSTDATGGARIASLFPLVEGNATIKNIALENSYLKTTSTSANYNFGGLIGSTPGFNQNSNADDSGIVWVDSCTVANNYMYAEPNNINRAGLVVGNIQDDTVIMSNCLVYGNDATAKLNSTAQYDLHIMGTIKTTVTPTDDFAAAHPTWINSGYVKAMVIDSIILDTPVYNTGVAGFSDNYRFQSYQCYEDVYTDMTLAAGQYTSAELYATTITTISKSQAYGADAETNLPGLAWGEKWYCGAYGELPIVAAFATFDAKSESTAEHQLYGSSVTYNDDGTLDFNLHFVPQYAGIKATLYVGTADTSKFYKLTATESSYREDLGDTALMFTLPNISARDIDKIWLPTIVVEGATLEWGKTQPIALVDNAMGVLKGDYDTADKNVAAALINYGVTADEALSTPSTEKDVATKVVYAPNNSFDGSIIDGTHGTGTESDPYIISTYGHWRFVVEKATYEETFGKFFKVDPTIKMFVFQSETFINKVGGLDAFLALDAQGVKEVFENGDAYGRFIMRHNNSGSFAGTLDGSGVQIVGMSGVYYDSSNVMRKGTGGLFGKIHEDATIKNLTISHTYNNTGDLNGVLIGWVANHSAANDNVRKITIENVVLHDNYQITTANGLARSGILIGRVDPGYIAIYLDGIISYDNLALGQRSNDTSVAGYSDMLPCALVGWYSSAWNGGTANPNGSYKNIISLGNAPYPVAAQANQGTKPEYWSNVYTDTITSFTPCTQTNMSSTHPANQWSSYDITVIDAGENNENIKNGKAIALCPKIDWTNKWVSASDNGYPAPVQKDVTIKTAGSTIYWDGTNTAPTTTAAGTEADPIIINTAAELKYVLRHAGPSVTAGKHYKIADGISTIVLQPEGVLDLNKLLDCKDGTAVKAYFDTLDASTLKTWDGSAVFNGNIDGNGVQIVGLYDTTTNVAGLVGAFDGGAPGVKDTPNVDSVGNTIKNFTVGYSYLKSNTRLGMFGSHAYNDGYGAYVIGTWNVDTCAVINCYMEQTTWNYDSGHSGIITGDASTDVMKLNNILVYGNKAFSSVDGNDIWMRAGTKTGQKIYVDGVETEDINYPTISNSIVLGATPYRTDWINNSTHGPSLYSNVYTDAPTGTVTLNNGATVTYTSEQIQGVTNLKGANAQSVVDALNAANDTTVWYVGALDDMPGFKKAGNVPAQYQSGIDSIVFTTADTVGAGAEYNSAGNMVFGVYQTALSLKANPYMSFAFAFYGDYKDNREKIKVRFTYTENGALTTTDEISVPAYTGEDIKNVNGWTNTAKNGRFHTFKAEMIPVEALAYGIKVEASYDGGAWQDFGTYSVEGLGLQFDSLSKTEPGDYYSTRVDAAKALLFYAQAISARYGAQ